MKKVLILILLIMSVVACEDNKPTVTRAGIMSEDIVRGKMKFPDEVEFDNDYRGKEISDKEFEVYQKFTAKNAFGVKSSYVYKIQMVYISGEWADSKNWSYGKLMIENIGTGQKSVYYGNNDMIENEEVYSKERQAVIDSLSGVIKGE